MTIRLPTTFIQGCIVLATFQPTLLNGAFIRSARIHVCMYNIPRSGPFHYENTTCKLDAVSTLTANLDPTAFQKKFTYSKIKQIGLRLDYTATLVHLTVLRPS